MKTCRKPYPSDVSDEEWGLIAPYLTLQREDAGQREHSLREVFNGLRYIVKTGAPWRWMPNDLPPWAAVYQQTQRWLAAGCFETLVDDLRAVLRLAAGRPAEPTAAIIDSRTLRSTPESGERAGYDGAKRKKGSKLHLAVDTLGHLLALHVTPASAEDRGEVETLARTVQAVTGDSVEIAWVDQGYTGERAAQAAQQHGITLEVVKLPEAKRGFVLLPRRWVVERSFAWATKFRRLVKDYERYAQTLAGLHVVAFACIMIRQVAALATDSQQSLGSTAGCAEIHNPWCLC
ncbi:MAG: IS5 family transposase [Novosphingobium sp.]